MSNLRLNLIIIALGSLITLFLLVILNLIIHFRTFSDSQINLITFIASLIIFLCIGFISGNIKSKSGLVNGVSFSLILVLIFVIIGLVNQTLNFSHIIRYIIMILAGGLGGVIGVNFKPMIK